MAGASSPTTVTRASSWVKAVYNPKAVIPHAALLHQASAHCAIFPTAASRRSLGRISVPMWPVALSGRLPVKALVGHYPTNKLIGRETIPDRKKLSNHPDARATEYSGLPPVSKCYTKVKGTFLTCYSPVRHSCTPESALPFDLHVLSTPPAFVLSQDQTLRKKPPDQTHEEPGPTKTTREQPRPHPEKTGQDRKVHSKKNHASPQQANTENTD